MLLHCELWRLALAELGSAAGGFEAVLLALFHSRVAGQETGGLEGGAEALVHGQQGAGDAVADGAGLAGHAAAGDGGDDVHLAEGVGGDQRLTDDQLQGLETEVVVDVTAVDGDGAGPAGEEVHARHGALPAAGAVHISLLALIGSHYTLPPLAVPDFGLLSGVGVLCAAEHAKPLELPVGDGVLLEHAAHGQTHGQLGLLLHQTVIAGLLESAGVAGVGAVVLLLELLARQDRLLGVDDDDIVAAVNMRGVVDLELAAEQVGRESGGLAQGLAGSVDNVPLADDGVLVKHGSGHFLASNYMINALTNHTAPLTIQGTRSTFIAPLGANVNSIFDFNYENSCILRFPRLCSRILDFDFQIGAHYGT